MKSALALASRGRGRVEPNPMVGALVVTDAGEVVGEGWHRAFGGPHAEVEALADARRRGVDPRGLTMVVTLEPCCHQGKTPPCTAALIDAGIARVIVAMVDPFPRVAGGGIEALRHAGIHVEVGPREADARALNAPFIKRLTTGLPWVIAKWAQTLDGKIATATGDSKWISGESSRAIAHELRARVDAIVVGIGTVLADDPALTARDVEVLRQARRVVIDPALRIPTDARLLTDNGPAVTVFCHHDADGSLERRRSELKDRGVEVTELRETRGRRLDLRPAMRHLADRHTATNIMIEGGAGVLGSAFEQGLVDEAWVFIAPKIVGDRAAPSAVAGVNCNRIADARKLRLVTSHRVGDDVMVRLLVDRDD
jgi:diaminohydroxyphosphoribosylaminopyrimidine deaminase/5-amino-6-(5-phosphoribosylamino)uracil reductase